MGVALTGRNGRPVKWLDFLRHKLEHSTTVKNNNNNKTVCNLAYRYNLQQVLVVPVYSMKVCTWSNNLD